MSLSSMSLSSMSLSSHFQRILRYVARWPWRCPGCAQGSTLSKGQTVAWSLLAIAVITGCNGGAQEGAQDPRENQAASLLDSINSSVSDLGKTIDTTTKETRKSVHQLATQELEKLYKYDYKVISLPASMSDQEMEAQLAELGRDRWNCFHGETVNESTRLLCSRLPLSVLKFVPYVWKVF